MQPLTPSAENIPTIQPLVVRFPELDAVNCVEFSADGKTLYAEIPADVIKLAPLVLDWGVWIAAAALLPVVLVAALLFWRIAQKPRTKGAIYCRKCNYEVGPTIESGGTQCTECGTAFSTKRPIAGRAAWRRRVPALVLVAIALTGGVVLAVPQSRKLALNWAATKAGVSRELLVILTEWSVPIPPWLIQEGVMLVELDGTTGNRIRTIQVRDGRDYAYGGLRRMPDGEHLLCITTRSVECVRVSDGKTVATFAPSGGSMQTRSPFQGFCDDGRSVLLTYWESGSLISRLEAWTPSTGAVRIIAAVPYKSGLLPSASGKDKVAREFGRELKVGARDAEGNITRVLSVPTRFETFRSKKYVVKMIDIPSYEHTIWTPKTGLDGDGSFAITADGRLGFVVASNGVIVGFDPSSGTIVGQLAARWEKGRDLELFHGDRWLCVAYMSEIVIRSLEEKRWMARLAFPKGGFSHSIAISPHNDRIAAAMSSGRAPRVRAGLTRHSSELAVWALSSLHATPTTPPAPNDEPAPAPTPPH